MPRKMIDISIPLHNDLVADPPGYGPSIRYFDHKQTAEEVCKFFPGLKVEELPDREGWAIEWIKLSTHCGTHLDAPYHFASTMDRGKRAATGPRATWAASKIRISALLSRVLSRCTIAQPSM